MVQCKVRPPQIYGLCTNWRTYNPAVHSLPFEQCVSRNAGRLLQLPHHGFHRQQESSPRAIELPSRLFHLSFNIQLAQRQVRSCALCKLSAHRRARHCDLRPVPRQQQLRRNSHRMLFMPQGRLHRNNKSESRHRCFPDGLLTLPHDHRLESGDLRSLHRTLPPHRRAYYCAVRAVPHQQQLRNHSNGLLLLP